MVYIFFKLNALILLDIFPFREIDAAFLRRFERKILIGLPNQIDRINIIKEFMPIALKWADKLLLELSEMSDGFTGDDIRIACKEASMKKIRLALKFNQRKSM